MIRYWAAPNALTKRSIPIRLSENTKATAPSAARPPQARARQSMALMARAYTVTGISNSPRPELISRPSSAAPTIAEPSSAAGASWRSSPR
ncbi:hypothetical protein D9M71_605710 [compost metagenome]